jgi:hypothetical protein
MKQTAVEWLKEQYNLVDGYESYLTIKNFIQAKEIEKQQIIDAYEKGFFDERKGKSPDEVKYYNETFNK